MANLIISALDYEEVEGGIGFTNEALNGLFGGIIPIGKLVELYGDWSTGKTLLCYDLLVFAQQVGAYTLLFETEGAFSKKFAARCGLDLGATNMVVPTKDQALTTDIFFETTERIMEENLNKFPFTVVAIDSLTGLNSQYRIEDGIDSYSKQYVGDMARIMNQGLNRLKGRLLPLRGILIIVNQMRDKIGVMFGKTEDTPGGRAVKFFADLRLRLSGKAKWIPKTVPARGQMGKMFVEKSKLAPPHGEQKFRLIFEAKDPQIKLGLDPNYKPRPGKDDDEE